MLRFLELLASVGNIYNQYMASRDFHQENYYLKEALSEERASHLETKNSVAAQKEENDSKVDKLAEDIQALAAHLVALTSMLCQEEEEEVEEEENVG